MEEGRIIGQVRTGIVLLTVLFIGLKLTGRIDRSWWWILSPIWIILAIVAVLVIVYVICVYVDVKTSSRRFR